MAAAYDPKGTGSKGMIGMSLASDISMVEPARMLARLHAASRQPTWQYRFSYVADLLRGVAFASSGDPNAKGLPKWPRYTPDGDQVLYFTLTGPVATADPWKARLDFVEPLATKGTR